MVKLSKLTGLFVMLFLAGACVRFGASVSVERATTGEREEPLPVSPTAAVPLTTPIFVVSSVPMRTPTETPALLPTATKTPTSTFAPTPVRSATFTATPTVSATAAPHVLADVRALNLRAGPGVVYTIVGSLPAGSELTLAGRNERGAWLMVEVKGRSGWVSAAFIANVPDDLPIMPTPAPPTPTPLPSTATPDFDSGDSTPPQSAEHTTVVLGPDTAWPVHAERVIGGGYEFVDASRQWDLVLHRDVYGVVAHEFWGERLYGQHPRGIRITLIDPIWDGNSPTPLAPLPLFAGDHGLTEGFGDGAGAMIYVGCAFSRQHYFDPQECFIAIASGGEHLSDIVVAATITAQHSWIAGYFARTPDFTQPPFHLLGQAYREGDQWRWREPFLEVAPSP